MITSALYAHLSALEALTIIVEDRIYNGSIEQDVILPAVLFTVTQESFLHNLGEASKTVEASVQVDCVSESLAQAYTMFGIIRESLDAFHGDLEGVTVQFAKLASAGELHQEPEDASDTWVRRVSGQYQIRYSLA